MKKCPNCGNVIENDNAKFCRKCGAKQPDMEIINKESTNVEIKNENDGDILVDTSKISRKYDGCHSSFENKSIIDPVSDSVISPITESENKGFWGYVKTCFLKYAVFNGRARRKEYWFFCLFNIIVSFILGAVDGFMGLTGSEIGLGVLGGFYSLAVFIPSLAVSVRRLHDIGKSGWNYMFIIIPIVGAILILIWFCTEGEHGINKWGPDPKM